MSTSRLIDEILGDELDPSPLGYSGTHIPTSGGLNLSGSASGMDVDSKDLDWVDKVLLQYQDIVAKGSENPNPGVLYYMPTQQLTPSNSHTTSLVTFSALTESIPATTAATANPTITTSIASFHQHYNPQPLEITTVLPNGEPIYLPGSPQCANCGFSAQLVQPACPVTIRVKTGETLNYQVRVSGLLPFSGHVIATLLDHNYNCIERAGDLEGHRVAFDRNLIADFNKLKIKKSFNKEMVILLFYFRHPTTHQALGILSRPVIPFSHPSQLPECEAKLLAHELRNSQGLVPWSAFVEHFQRLVSLRPLLMPELENVAREAHVQQLAVVPAGGHVAPADTLFLTIPDMLNFWREWAFPLKKVVRLLAGYWANERPRRIAGILSKEQAEQLLSTQAHVGPGLFLLRLSEKVLSGHPHLSVSSITAESDGRLSISHSRIIVESSKGTDPTVVFAPQGHQGFYNDLGSLLRSACELLYLYDPESGNCYRKEDVFPPQPTETPRPEESRASEGYKTLKIQLADS